jgi:ubiquinone/menaquinone biosynthesis C-methylase UbiE
MKTPSIDYNQVADKYAQYRGVVPVVLESLTRRLGPTSRVLEVGCGTGNYISAMEASVGCSCWGTDPSEQMLRQAVEQSRRVHFPVGRAEQMDPNVA